MQIKKASETRIFSKSTNLSLAADAIKKTENPVLSAIKKADIKINTKDQEMLAIESYLSSAELQKWKRMSPSRRERLLKKASKHPAVARLEAEIKKEKEQQKYREKEENPSFSGKTSEDQNNQSFSESHKEKGVSSEKNLEQDVGKVSSKSVETGAKAGAKAGARASADVASGGTYELVRAAGKATKKVTDQIKSSLDKSEEGKKESLTEDQQKQMAQFSSGSHAIKQMAKAVAAAIGAITPLLVQGFLLPLLIVALFFSIFTTIFSSATQSAPVSANLSQATVAYASLVHEVSESMGLTLEDETNILAIIEVESHGSGNNPMQWSNDITGDGKFDEKDDALMTPEKSIRLGIGLYKQLRDRQAQTGCDIETMIQAYNYGPGFINFVMANGGKYSEDLAYQFSANMKKKHGLKVYGDPSYVSKWKKYIASESISPIDSSVFQTIHDEAYKYIGKAYVFGGSDPNTGFDCSGFTKWCFAKAGIQLPRTAQEQYNATTHIGIEQAQPGDLVFFTGTYDTSDYITHVEIYVGNHTSIGAGDPIREHNLDGTYYKNHFVCFGRVGK